VSVESASLTLAPIAHASGTVLLPGSKSISIRALLLAAFAEGETTLLNLLDSDDTKVMLSALRALGVTINQSSTGVTVKGGSVLRREADLFMGNSGLSIRTLLPAIAALKGRYRLSGVERMHQRPIGDLVDALNSVGASIRYLARAGFPPIQVTASAIDASRGLSVAGHASSQFLSGLLQAAPIWNTGREIEITVTGRLISAPYVALTVALMDAFGVDVAADLARHSPVLHVPAGAKYQSPGTYLIEGDASSASYFLALGALTGGAVILQGITEQSAQPDIRFLDALKAMGATITSSPSGISASSPGVGRGFKFEAIDADMNHIPDAAMTLAVVCMFANGPSRLKNIGSWRVKESDRLAAMAAELRKFGADIEEGADWIGITPPTHLIPAAVETYDDHRIAMSLSLMACGGVHVTLADPTCVNKTFPRYFEQLKSLSLSN
jgi:3-phosphoshikimate 1-carboxyvinyltransferase